VVGPPLTTGSEAVGAESMIRGMARLQAEEFERTSASTGGGPPDPFAPEWRRRYLTEVQPEALRLLAATGGPRFRRQLLAPVAYTLKGRRNLFRSVLSLAAGDAAGAAPEGNASAVAGELAWTCALVIDDLVDGSAEREGHVAAHVVFGPARTAAGALAALAVLLWYGARRADIAVAARLRMIGYGLRLLRACAMTQVPSGARRTLEGYSRYARDVNCSTHWAISAPFVARAQHDVCASLQRWGDAISLNGKIRNDLHDYCGGSSECDTPFKDFHTRTVSFPVLLLLASPLAGEERRFVERHFLSDDPSDLALETLLDLFWRTGTLVRCIDHIRSNADVARAAALAVSARCDCAGTLVSLMETWNTHIVVVAEDRVQAARERDRR
jgi:geranylgeranyl pyrophosphate synthase